MPDKSAARTAAIRALAADAVTCEVVAGLRAAGVEPVLLKGPTTADWLYPGELRSYNDTDLLVSPGDQESAALVLGELGFGYVETGSSERERDDHSRTFARAGAEVDLHFTLSGVHIQVDRAWQLLTADLSSTTVAGTPVATLGAPARTLHLVLHAADSGGQVIRTRTDLERAIAATDQSTWQRVVGLARELAAMPAFVAGLRQVPAGVQLLAQLGIEEAATPYTLLRATNTTPGALGMARLLELSPARWPVEIWRQLVPSPAFMRTWSRLASRGPVGLTIAYLYRPVWLLSRIWPAYAAHRRVKR